MFNYNTRLDICSSFNTDFSIFSYQFELKKKYIWTYAAVNGKLKLTLLKGRQRFDTVSTSNLKM